MNWKVTIQYIGGTWGYEAISEIAEMPLIVNKYFTSKEDAMNNWTAFAIANGLKFQFNN